MNGLSFFCSLPFDDIGDLSDDFAYDVESEEEYLFCYAECILKCHILCAAQIAFGFPLWQDPKFLEWEKPIREALKEIDDYAAENDDEFCFPRFFPYYSNEYVAYPRFMIRWISDVMEEFFEKADANGYYLSPEERQKQFEKASRELRMIEDFLSGKSTDLDFKNSTSE